MTPSSCREAEQNMGLSPPFLQNGSRRPGGVESPSGLSPLLPAPLPLFQLHSALIYLQSNLLNNSQFRHRSY